MEAAPAPSGRLVVGKRAKHGGESREKHDFEISETAFFEILEEYKPDLVIAWGARLEGNLPQKNKTLSDFLILNTLGHVFHYYNVAGKKIPVYAIYHPSSPAFASVVKNGESAFLDYYGFTRENGKIEKKLI